MVSVEWLERLKRSETLDDLVTWFERPEDARSSRSDLAVPPLDHPDFATVRLVGRGPLQPGERADDPFDSWIWLRDDSDELWLALNDVTEPSLFIPIGNSADSVASELRARVLEPHPERSSPHDRIVLFALGLIEDMRTLENRFVTHAFINGMPLRLAGDESPACVAAAFQTRYSRSRIDLTAWSGFFPDARVAFARVAYAASSNARVVERYNRERDKNYSLDLPLDVIGAFDNMPFTWPIERIVAELDTSSHPELCVVFLTLIDPNREPEEIVRDLLRLKSHMREPIRNTAAIMMDWVGS